MTLREIVGSGAPVLLIHGFTDCMESYALMAPHLGMRRLIIPDLRGHGLSFRADDMSLDALTGDIRSLLGVLGTGPLAVVGHSLGALVALRLASTSPETVSRLALLSGSLRPQSARLAALSEEIKALPTPLRPNHAFFESWHHCERPVPRGFRSRLAASAARMRHRDWMGCLQTLEAADLFDEAGHVSQPAIVLSGDKDPIFDLSHQARLVARLPRASHLRYPELGHNPHWEAPMTVGSDLSAFLKSGEED